MNSLKPLTFFSFFISLFLISELLAVKTSLEIWNLEENGKNILRHSLINASKSVYKINKNSYNNSEIKEEIRNLLHLDIDQDHWKKIQLFSTALNSKILRSSDNDADNSTNPFTIPKNHESRNDHFGLIAFRDDEILIAFKGTDSIKGWISNLSYKKQNIMEFHNQEKGMNPIRTFFSKYDNEETKMLIHRGFMRAALSSQEEIFEHINEHLLNRESSNPLQVMVTGHSLGAAMATIFSAPLKIHLDDVVGQNYTLNLFTFGSPRVFAERTARAFETELGGKENILRIVTKRRYWGTFLLGAFTDKVTELPPRAEGPLDEYDHVGGTRHDLDATGKVEWIPLGFVQETPGINTIHSVDIYKKHVNNGL